MGFMGKKEIYSEHSQAKNYINEELNPSKVNITDPSKDDYIKCKTIDAILKRYFKDGI